MSIHKKEEKGQACDSAISAILVDGEQTVPIECARNGETGAVEIEGGLYHVITRGNNRQKIFQSHEDHLKFLR